MTFSKLSKEAAQELVIPPGSLELSLHRAFGTLQLSQVEGQPTEKSNIFRPMILPSALTVLVHRHVQDPVRSVLDTPLRPSHLGEPRRRKRRAQQIIRRLRCGLA